MKIVEGLHVEEVGHLRWFGLLYGVVSGVRPSILYKKRSLIWQPHTDNWLAARIMKVLMEERDGSTEETPQI